MLAPGTRLVSRNRQHEAVVMADSFLRTEAGVGSIHKAGALVQKATACNGWDFWFFEGQDGALRSIDELRQRYLQIAGTPTKN